MRSVILVILLAVGLGVGGWYWNRARTASAATAAAEAARARPTTATVERGSIQFSVGVAGEIGPAEQVSVRPEVNGKISELPVDVGDRVPKGGLLFALDDRDLRIEAESREKQIESAKLQLDKARIAMEQAKRDYQRDQQLFEEKLLSTQAFEASRERYDSSAKDHDLARNSIERSEKELDLAKERLLKTRISAPFDCTVLTRPVSAGQAVSGSGGFNSGTEVLTIADLSSMIIAAHVNQADVTHLRSGMDVVVEVDAIPGLKTYGKVERMAPQATVKNGIKGYATRIALRSVDPHIQPGMTANITVPVAAANDILTVPLTAVFSEQNEHFAYVKNGDTIERRDVVIGLHDPFKAEIKSGLSEGEIVSFEQPGGANAGRIPGGGPALAQPSGNRPSTVAIGSTNVSPAAPKIANGTTSTGSRSTPGAGAAGSVAPTAAAATISGTATQRPGTARPGT